MPDTRPTLNDALDRILIDNNPKLRTAIRDALDKGARPKEVLRLYGWRRGRTNLTASAVTSIVEEWQKEHGQEVKRPNLFAE